MFSTKMLLDDNTSLDTNLYFCLENKTNKQVSCLRKLYVFFATHIFTARKRSLRRLCFYRCLSVHMGGHMWLLGGVGGMCGCSGGACVVTHGGGMRGCSGGMNGCPRGHAWLVWGVGGMHGCSWGVGVCMG